MTLEINPQCPEPVAWCREWQGDVSDLGNMIVEFGHFKPTDGQEWQPLYAHPPAAAERIALLEGLLKKWLEYGELTKQFGGYDLREETRIVLGRK